MLNEVSDLTLAYLHLLCSLSGPIAPPGTGVLAIQSTAGNMVSKFNRGFVLVTIVNSVKQCLLVLSILSNRNCD